MEFCHFFLFVTFVVLIVDQFAERGDGPFELHIIPIFLRHFCPRGKGA